MSTISSFFQNSQHLVTGTAPGRLDVMGGIADYSGSWVLQMPIREQAAVRAALRDDGLLRVFSADLGEVFKVKISELPTDYAAARAFFAERKNGSWAAYVVGCLLVLNKAKNLPFPAGLDLHVQSDVPIGKGVSSSAAIEIATMRALGKLFNVNFQGTEMALLAQQAENQVAGSPCGLMDQLASCFGRPGSLLPIHCQPDRLLDPIELPPGIAFLGLDSGIRHAVSGASYGNVRTAAYMGYSLIACAEGASPDDLHRARRAGHREALPYGGYLCNISPSVFEKKYARLLPEVMRGEDFLKNFGETADPVSSVAPGEIYRVQACVRHPVYENARVQAFAALIRQTPTMDSLRLLGKWMYQSHESYSSVGLGNAHTDEIVEMVRAAGEKRWLFGAKITGGGSGGTVCVLCFGNEGLAAAREVFENYRSKYGGDLKLIQT